MVSEKEYIGLIEKKQEECFIPVVRFLKNDVLVIGIYQRLIL